VTLFDYDIDEFGPYLVMELLRGEDLSSHIRTKGPLGEAEVRTIALHVIDALLHAHGHGIVHRDIKPSNLYLLPSGTVKVLDFGLARSSGDQTLSLTGAGLGTADYVAPEQADDATLADARSDQYSLGATIIHLLTARIPRLIRERELPGRWRDLLFRMTEQSPAERYQSLIDVRLALLDIDLDDLCSCPVQANSAGPGTDWPLQPTASKVQKFSRQPSVDSWADVLVSTVDTKVVTDHSVAKGIASTSLPWRVRERVSGIEMVLVPAGTYVRGAKDDQEATSLEVPPHIVTISSAFYIGVYEVTQHEWSTLMGSNPSSARGSLQPVDSVSWEDTQKFLAATRGLRLPTEAEWEYACRAGTTEPRYGNLDAIAWYDLNSGQAPHPVGGKLPNAFGLYDMLGNVWEWCSDWYEAYELDPQVDPKGPPVGGQKVCRGGSWYRGGRACRSSSWLSFHPSTRLNLLGFRVARFA
jgi:formylglycine-generating enzyme required for sulfatase activity